jgi:threonine dehydratase
MRLLFAHAGLVVEPAGAIGVAAVLEHPMLRGSRLATVLCGANVTPAQADEWFLQQGDAS